MARPDLDALLNTVLPFARQMLIERGEFYPFGATMKADGKIEQRGAYTGEEFPEPQELIGLLLGAYRAQAAKGELRATALCFDARTIPPQTEKTDAICVRLEHEDGEAVDVFIPYRKERQGDLTWGDLFATRAAQRSVFSSPSEADRGRHPG
jgi:hypothetical protein